jgi:copper oxidase (laccase) domain-containing protein
MKELGAREILAAIGPTISQNSYEVGPEFHARFVEVDPTFQRFFTHANRDGHYMFDLPGFVHSQLEAMGVVSIENLGICTYSNEAQFFSYRRATHRTEADYGRQMSAITIAD